MSNTPEPTDRRALLKEALDAVERMQGKLDAAERRHSEPIAIVGIGCRIPGGGSTPETFWALLRDGVDAIREAPAGRWEHEAYARLGLSTDGDRMMHPGGFLDQIDRFDARFFGLSPREAATLDPQHRLLLEVCWEALEHAGQAPDRLAGSATGVFIGISTWEYSDIVKSVGPRHIDLHAGTGTAHNTAAGRISYMLGLRGPCLAVDTACSSSLVAVHLACDSLRRGESRLALAGGVNAIVIPDAFGLLTRAGVLAPDGRCKTFDEAADGFVRAEGCGIVVLKRLGDAIADRDTVLGIIRGSAINQDGASSGLTVPNGLAQQEVIRQALTAAKIAPADVDYVEAHGTGTSLGDPIELEALATVLGVGRSPDRPFMVGSVKTNIGHLEAAAGVVGLIKVVLALQHEEIPPHLHFKKLTPRASMGAVPVIVPTTRTPWPSGPEARIAGVSAFGLSGTNAHIIVAEAPARALPPAATERPVHLLALSAKSDAALAELADRYERRLGESRSDIGDVCFTAATGRAQFAHRLALTVRSEAEAREALGRLASGQSVPRATRGRARSPRPRAAFLFTGQGSQYVDMGRDLYRTSDTFRRVLDRCDTVLRPLLPRPLLSVMYPEAGAPSPLDETQYTQPALFALEYALAETWREWGITPSFVLGHSVGEYVAACVAGVLGLEDALGLIAVRGRLMQSLPAGGAMAAVFAGEAEVADALRGHPDQLAIAAINAPDNIVVSGAAPALATVLEQLTRRGIRTQALTVSHAFHSPLMDPILDEFHAAVGRMRLSAPRIGLVSNVTGRLATGEEMASAGYWRRHVRAPVRFAAGLATLREQGVEIFVEAGPAPTLLGLGRRAPGAEGTVWLPSLRKGSGDWEQMLDSLGRLYVEGFDVDWAGLDRQYPRRRVALPAYPFQRERYWVEPARDSPPPADVLEGHPLVGRRITSPRLQEAVFQYTLRADHPSFLGDHRVHGTVVFPGTAYLETMLAVAKAALGDAPLDLGAVTIRAPMILDGEAERMVQVIVGAPADGASPVEVFSRSMDDERPEAWQLHATARVSPRDTDGCGHLEDHQTEARRRCAEGVAVSDFYEQLADIGLDYGETFRGVRELWRGQSEGFGLVEIDAARLAGLDGYHAHPAVLDACLHLFGVALASSEPSSEDVYVPVGVERFRLFRAPGARVWARATVGHHQSTEGTLVGDLHLFDDTGAVVACLAGISLRRMPPEALGRAVTAGWLYEVAWRSQALPAPTEERGPGRWLILADRGGAGAALARRLEAQGHRCELAFAGVEGPDGDARAVDLSSPDGVARWWAGIEQPAELSGVAHLWSLDAPALDVVAAGARERGQTLGVASVLHLVQAMVASAAPVSKLVLVTRGAQYTGAEPAMAPTQALVWGLARVVRSEHPALQVACIDLDPSPSPGEDVALAAEALSLVREDEIALRAGGRYVARLAPRVSTADATSAGPAAGETLRLEITTRGVLDNLRWTPVKRTPPGPGQVEIEVHVSGLNFRDVLNTLGMYPGDAGALGSECAGRVCAVGEGVGNLRPGDEVIAMTSPAFATHVTADARLVVRKPAAMTMDEAATIPIAFLTAAYGLHELARIKPGERVLIHAAAGGVGLAALQVARRAGAEIFATAGSPAKRDYLTSLGVRHVMDSRSVRFADEVMASTGGEGIDIVLNSLSGDFIPASLRTLRAGGRFIEIGKRGVWDQARVADAYPGVVYHVFYLGEACSEDPLLIGSMLQTLVDDMAHGALTPLPLRTFAAAAAAAAFRHMAQARHIGKVVVAPPAPSRAPLAIRSDATYLITGGLGALGLQVARWLHDEGARHLVLMGRREPSGPALEAIRTLEADGSRVHVARGDVSCAADVSRILEEAAAALPPLRGVVHAAGVLDDGVLAQQNWERFIRVMAPKVTGAVNLHRLTEGTPLDLFVLFSSASALLGSPGQANYVAANAFLDALAQHRRALGLPAVSINWGPWTGGGMAAAAESRPSRGPARGGVRWITPERGRALLARVVREPVAQVGVLSIDWASLATATPAQARRSLLAELVGGGASPRPGAVSAPGQLRAQLAAAAPAGRPGLMVAALKEHLASVLRTPAEGLDTEESLTQLGIDSLMAVELKNRIETDLGLPTPVGDLLEGPSLSALAASLCRKLADVAGLEIAEDGQAAQVDTAPARTGIVGSGEDARQLLVRLPALDDDEVMRLLLERGGDEAGPAGGAEPRSTLARLLGEEARTAVVHPTSHGQQALWFLHHLAPDSPAYHILFAARLRSAVKADRLQSVLQFLVDRHPALRTTFEMEGDRPIQRVHGECPVRLEHVDVSAATPEELRRRVTASAQRPFDLGRGPIMRAALFTRAADDHVLLLAIHHLAMDAWSFEMLFRDFGELYAAAEAGRPANLSPLPCRYSDFVAWQDEMLAGPGGDRAKRYWEAELAGDLPLLTLRTDRPRPPRPRFRGASLPFLLDEGLAGRLRELAAGEGATPYMVLLAAYQVLLRRETGQEEILVGSPVAGRARPEFASTIGYFVNTVVVRGTTAGNPTFRSFLRAIRDKALRAIEHQDYPFPMLVKQLGVSREGGRSPVFQTLFNFIRAPHALDLSRFFVAHHPTGKTRMGDLVVEPFPLSQQEGQFDLELEMSEIAGTLGGRFKYDTDLFDRVSIVRLAGVFKALLDVIASDPDRPVSWIIAQDRLAAAADDIRQADDREEIDL
jgi:acyl transferase domain-containing protein